MTIGEKSTMQKFEEFSLLKIIFSIFSIIILRLFLENYVYPDAMGYFFSTERVIHAILYFFSLYFSLSLLLYFFTKDVFENILIFVSKIFLFILAVPVVDFIFNTMTSKAFMAYLTVSPDKFLTTFLDILNPLSRQGVTFGQHFAAYAILISMIIFVHKRSKDIIRILFLIASVYLTLFFYEMIPSFIMLFGSPELLANQDALSAYHSAINQSWFSNYTEGFDSFNEVFFKTEIAHEITMAKIFFITLTLQLGLIFFTAKRKFWNGIQKDLRITRIIYWFIIAAIGIVISQKINGDIHLENPINIISLLVFLIVGVLNAWLAAFVNDGEDIKIDTISNPDRPLITKAVSLTQWNVMQLVFLILISFGMFTMNKSVISLFFVTQTIFYLYSSSPLRLKRHFATSTILSGIAVVAIAMAGFFLVSPNQHVNAFPIKAILIIGISYGLLSNFKDIKDFAGDSHEKIKTLPVVFGLQRSKYIIAAIWSIVLITVPLLLDTQGLMLPLSVCVSLFLFYLFTKKEYQEKYIFLAFFFYALALFLVTY
ncbi:MAG: hypothetical protein US63_C0013G0013 [Candidatus Moranbacteria bacterium GW2011_GWC2_37_8]|nr:MAG: hypothetical protein US63_C0013G0013 [Candidatus Moranbacteria bacterium GW2011_GWC2_37_8]KKQ62302.1 MAG: hypothetical protein US82_C0014G0013 [Parcubacteria group bacterium GW2011_GWC1_38_22]